MAILIYLMVIPAILIILQIPNYRHYRRTYRALLTGEVSLDRTLSDKAMTYFGPGGQAYAFPGHGIAGLSDRRVIHFRTSDDFSLMGGRYLHSAFAWADPYSLYWLIRLRRLAKRLASGEDPLAINRKQRLSRILN